MTEHLPRELADGMRTDGVGSHELRQHISRPRRHQEARSLRSTIGTPNCAAPASATPAKNRTPSPAANTVGVTAVSETTAALAHGLAGVIGRALALQVSAPRPYAARCPGSMRTLPKACPHRAAANPATPIRAAAVKERPTRNPWKRPNHTSRDREVGAVGGVGFALGTRGVWAGSRVVIAGRDQAQKSKSRSVGCVRVGVGP